MPDGMAQDQPSAARQQADPQALEAENASLKDRMLRALADAENTRRHAERTAEEARRYAIADFARELLTVADNLKRAIAAADSQGREGRDDSLVEGVRATERMLRAVFERFGIRKIDALGAPFDPARHEALMEVEDHTHLPGTVVRVVDDGYMIRDRLLRPARVVVSRRRPRPLSSSDSAAAHASFPTASARTETERSPRRF